MKTLSKLLLFLSAILLITACNNNPSSQTNNKTIIAGKILNYENHKDVKSFRIYHYDFFNGQYSENVEIQEDGNFKTSFSFPFNTISTIRFEKAFAHFIAMPNDSLYLTIDANILNDNKVHPNNANEFVKLIDSKKTNNINLTNLFMVQIRTSSKENQDFFNTKTFAPLSYVAYLQKNKKKKEQILDSLMPTNKPEIVKLWAKDFIKYKDLINLLRFPGEYAYQNKLNIDSLPIPSEYYNLLTETNLNDNRVFSFYHIMFFGDYNLYIYKQAEKNGVDFLDYIINNTSGFSKDILVAKYFFTKNLESATPITIPYHLIQNKKVKGLLKSRIEVENKKKEELQYLKIKSLLSDSLFSKYKGKIVYVDFWGTWCVPCLNEMPSSVKLQERFKDKPVVFLFLCNRCTYEGWQKTIKEKGITGEHVLLTDQEYKELAKLYDIKGVPHYLLIDKEGRIRNNAPRPSNKITEKEIQKLLNK